MSEIQTPQKLSLAYRVKRSVIEVSLLAFGTAFEIVSRHSPELKAELKGWEEGFSFSLGVAPLGPAVALRKEGDRIVYLGKGQQEASLQVFFKNLDSAFLLFTGQMGAHMAFAEHRAFVHGSITEAIKTNRAMNIVQKFLMPGLILKKTFKRPPKLGLDELALKARVMATLGLGMMLNLRK